MLDDPGKQRLLEEVAAFLRQQVLPAVDDPALSFRVRIASHLVAMVAREEAAEEDDDATELVDLVGLGLAQLAEGRSATRQAIRSGREALARRIQQDGSDEVVDRVILRSLERRLAVGNPRFNLGEETGEDEWTS